MELTFMHWILIYFVIFVILPPATLALFFGTVADE